MIVQQECVHRGAQFDELCQMHEVGGLGSPESHPLMQAGCQTTQIGMLMPTISLFWVRLVRKLQCGHCLSSCDRLLAPALSKPGAASGSCTDRWGLRKTPLEGLGLAYRNSRSPSNAGKQGRSQSHRSRMSRLPTALYEVPCGICLHGS